ncbi:hypothetical protein F5880DRAFT_1617737 [Lentinula raphanica]|nr:hypothetical protein F5880DRAFT_1617737 [Lentinula raphanica]
MSAIQQRFVYLNANGGSFHTSMQWRRSGSNAHHLPICIQANSNTQARIILENLQPLVTQHGNAPLTQFVAAITASTDLLNAIEAELYREEGLTQGTRIWWHARYATHAGIYESTRECLDSVDHSNANFQRAFGFRRFREALYSALTFDLNPPGLLFDYNPHHNAIAAASVRASIYPHGIMSTIQPPALAVAPAPTTPVAPVAAPAPATPVAAPAPATPVATPVAAPAPATPVAPVAAPAPITPVAAPVPMTPVAPVVSAAPPSASNISAVNTATQRRSGLSPRPHTPDRGITGQGLVPMASGGVVIYSPRVNISYGDTPTKSKGKGHAHATTSFPADGFGDEFGGIDWVRHFLFCQKFDNAVIQGIEHLLEVVEDCEEFIESVHEGYGNILSDGTALFLYDLYHGVMSN